MNRSTRILAHPDGSFTVEFAVLVKIAPKEQFGIPRTVTEWVRDPGFAPQLARGFIGQHTEQAYAEGRAHVLSICDDDDIYATIIKTVMKPDTEGQVN